VILLFENFDLDSDCLSLW